MTETGKSYIDHWNDKFLAAEWGRYPPEELVRFIGRNYKKTDRTQVKILEVGCGPGANIWFLHREGYHTFGIDGAPAAIDQAQARVQRENAGLNKNPVDLRVGNFAKLPWESESFDVAIDVVSICANTRAVIDSTISEVYRVLKPGGKFFSKFFGRETTGYGNGKELDPGTFNEIKSGPTAGMGVIHFFDQQDISETFKKFSVVSIDRVLRTDQHSSSTIEEFVCVFKKD